MGKRRNRSPSKGSLRVISICPADCGGTRLAVRMLKQQIQAGAFFASTRAAARGLRRKSRRENHRAQLGLEISQVATDGADREGRRAIWRKAGAGPRRGRAAQCAARRALEHTREPRLAARKFFSALSHNRGRGLPDWTFGPPAGGLPATVTHRRGCWPRRQRSFRTVPPPGDRNRQPDGWSSRVVLHDGAGSRHVAVSGCERGQADS